MGCAGLIDQIGQGKFVEVREKRPSSIVQYIAEPAAGSQQAVVVRAHAFHQFHRFYVAHHVADNDAFRRTAQAQAAALAAHAV